MTINVVVNDKSGRPVSGLTEQDFTLLVNKLPQKIVSFSTGGTAPGNDVQIVIVLDAVNTSFSKVGYARDQIDHFLQEDGGRLTRPVSIGIFTDRGLDMQQEASRDGNALAKYLNEKETGLRFIRRSQGYYGAVDRTLLSLRALEQLAAFEKPRPGRKLVIWVSPGWPLLSGPNTDLTQKQEQDIFNTIIGLSGQIENSRITLYSVDPLGTADSGQFRTFYYEQFLKPATKPNQVQLGNVSLQVLASHSGGRVLNGNNDVAAEIRRCASDADSYYVLSFDSPSADGPNEYRSIQVKIEKPELKAQTLAGYYAQPRGSGTP